MSFTRIPGRGLSAGITCGLMITAGALIPSVAAADEGLDRETKSAPAGILRTCFVTTVHVPAYDVPNDLETVLWVNQGQGLDVYVTDGPWRGGTLWGGPGGKWIHSNYLRTAEGNPC